MVRQVSVLAFDEDFITVVGNSASLNVDSACRLNGYFANGNTPSNLDEQKVTRFFSKGGTYKIRLVCFTSTDSGKIDIGLDANDATNIFNQLDFYSASAVRNAIKETTLEISRGYHDIHFKANGKNASSSGYIFRISALEFDLIQEYPVYQDDDPANGWLTEGEIGIGYHSAAVAESTFTFNLADVKNTKYDEIRIKINGGATASLELQAVLNSLNSGISQNGFSAIGATLAVVNLSARSSVRIASTSILTGATDFEAELIFKKNASGVWEMGRVDATGYAVGRESSEFSLGSPTLTSVNTVVIQTSTSTWKAGTTISVRGVKYR